MYALLPVDWTMATPFCMAFQITSSSACNQSRNALLVSFRASRGMLAYRRASGANNLAPVCISDLQNYYKPSRNLRSVDQGLLTIPRSNQRNNGDRAFSVPASKLWNALPLDTRNSGSIALFKSRAKTFLFEKSYL